MGRRSFRELIRNIRSAAFLTQQQLADLLEVSPGTISRWERGVCDGRLKTAWKIESIFQLSPLQLSGEGKIINLENLADSLPMKQSERKPRTKKSKQSKNK